MIKPLKIGLSVFAAIILLLVIAAASLPLLFNPNDVKSRIASAVKAQTGRDLTISGDLELSIFPWLGVSAAKLTLSNAPGFQDQPFAQIENAQIKAKLLPLLSKKFEIDKIVLKDLVLNLERNANGIANWIDPGQAKPDHETSATAIKPVPDTKDSDTQALTTAASLVIAGITLDNARLNWNDRQNDAQFSIKALHLISSELAVDKPIDLQLSFTLDLPKQELSGHYKLKTELRLNDEFDRFNLNRFDLSAEMRGKTIPGGSLAARLKTSADLNWTAQTLELNDLTVDSGPLNLTTTLNGSNIIDRPVFEGPIHIARFNPSELLKQFGIAPLEMRDPKALSALNADFQLQVTPDSADLQDIVINLDDITIKGNTRVEHFNDPAIAFNLQIDHLNADRYSAPNDDKDDSAQPIAGPAAAVAAGASLIPVETLRNLNINGLLTIERLTVNNLSLHGINVTMTARDGQINTEQRVKTLYRGAYDGAMSLDVTGTTPQWRLNEKFNGIQIEPFLTDFTGHSKIAGTLTASSNLAANGNSGDAIKSSLNGRIDFLFKDSIIKGVNLQQMIDDAKSLLKGSQEIRENPKDQTAFSEIKGSARITNGIIRNDDLIATASKINATGSGTANLNDERIDYKVNARIVRSKSNDEIKEVPIVIDITGTFKQPEYRLDIASMLKDPQMEKFERKKDKLLEKLDKKLGPGASDLLKRFF